MISHLTTVVFSQVYLMRGISDDLKGKLHIVGLTLLERTFSSDPELISTCLLPSGKTIERILT